MADNKKLVEAITSPEEDFTQWYTDVVVKAGLVSYSNLKGFIILKPAGYALWENIQKHLDARFKATGVENVYMPLLIPEGLIPTVAVVLILFREFVVSGIRLSGAEQGVVIAANIWGKLKTLFQDLSLVAILLLRAIGASFLVPLSNVLIWICAALTVLSGVIYVAQNIKVLKEE